MPKARRRKAEETDEHEVPVGAQVRREPNPLLRERQFVEQRLVGLRPREDGEGTEGAEEEKERDQTGHGIVPASARQQALREYRQRQQAAQPATSPESDATPG
jgi:hypothetical protein